MLEYIDLASIRCTIFLAMFEQRCQHLKGSSRVTMYAGAFEEGLTGSSRACISTPEVP